RSALARTLCTAEARAGVRQRRTDRQRRAAQRLARRWREPQRRAQQRRAGGDKVRIAYLLDRKRAPIDAQDLQGETALHIAIRQRSAALVRYLLEHGAGVAVPDRDGWTPLMTAAWVNEASIVTLLTKQHADPNAPGA